MQEIPQSAFSSTKKEEATTTGVVFPPMSSVTAPKPFGFTKGKPANNTSGGFSFNIGSTTASQKENPTSGAVPSVAVSTSAPVPTTKSSEGGFSFTWGQKSSFGLDSSSIAPKTKKKVYRASLKKQTNDSSSSLEGYEHYRSFMDKLVESGVGEYCLICILHIYACLVYSHLRYALFNR